MNVGMLARSRVLTEYRPSSRLGWVDGVRGVAILLMVLDHTLAIVEPTSIVRYTVTRASLPLFALSAGWLLEQRTSVSPRRAVEMAGAALAGSAVFGIVGLGPIDPMASMLVALLLWPVASRSLVTAALVGFVLAMTFPVAGVYSPGYVVGLYCVVALYRRSGGLPLPAFVSWPGWLRWIGARPVAVYVAHLPLLVGVRAVVAS